LDPGGVAIQPGSAFDTVFYPGVKNPAQAVVFTVMPGQALDSVIFNVQPRAASSLYSIETYSFPGP